MTAVPVAITVVRYRCPFCSRSRAKKAATVEHIARCWNNPAVRGCKTCALHDRVPGGPPCFPGRLCGCNDGRETCDAEVGLSGGLKTNCPHWQPTREDNDE